MSSPTTTHRWSTSVAWIIVPLIIAMSAGIGSGLALGSTIDNGRNNDARIDELERGTAHGRISGSLFMRHALDVVRDHDAAYARQSDAIREFTDVVFAEETARLEELRSSNPSAFTTELDDLIGRATAPDADLDDRLNTLFDFYTREPGLATPEGRASLQLSTGVYLTPTYLVLERVVADALINERADAFALPQDEAILALRDGVAGYLPTDPSNLFFSADPVDDAEVVLPQAFAAVEREFQRTDDLQATARWLAEFSPFFEDGPSAITAAPETVSDDLDAIVALFIRVDRALIPELQRVINAERSDAAQQSNRGWAIAIFGSIVTVSMLILTAAGVTRRRRELAALRSEASLDSLTGLPNRRTFNERANRHFAEGTGGHVLFAIDIDEFKQINDSLGHAAGDDVLCELGHRLESIIERWSEAFSIADAHTARLGGDEFVVALHGVDLPRTDLALLAEDLRMHTCGPVDTVAGAAELRVSLGCSSAASVDNIDELAQRADLALYDAKHTGRDRSSVFVAPEEVDWNAPSVAERVLAKQEEPTLVASAEFVRELVDLTQRFGVELTTSTRPGAHDSTGTDGIRVNLILVESSDEPKPNRRFTDFPANAGGPSSAAGSPPSEQH